MTKNIALILTLLASTSTLLVNASVSAPITPLNYQDGYNDNAELDEAALLKALEDPTVQDALAEVDEEEAIEALEDAPFDHDALTALLAEMENNPELAAELQDAMQAEDTEQK